MKLPTDPRFQDLTNKIFESYTVLEYMGKFGKNSYRSYWKCECVCGAIKKVCGCNLVSGHSTSCGCARKRILSALRTVHGHTKRQHGQRTSSKEYRAWAALRKRCSNKKVRNYKDYGGRGIYVCERWDKFENFLKDMGNCPCNHSIDRKDNDGPYSPENCRWADIKTQARNKRVVKKITFQNKTLPIPEWADLLGMNSETLHCRLRNGWSIERALTTPVSGTID